MSENHLFNSPQEVTEGLNGQNYIASEEIAKRSFRLLAVMGSDALEIRAVQGAGPTHVFILYSPEDEIPAAD